MSWMIVGRCHAGRRNRRVRPVHGPATGGMWPRAQGRLSLQISSTSRVPCLPWPPASPADNFCDRHPPLPRTETTPIALTLMTSPSKSTFVLGHRHLLGIEGLSAADITGLLDL